MYLTEIEFHGGSTWDVQTSCTNVTYYKVRLMWLNMGLHILLLRAQQQPIVFY